MRLTQLYVRFFRSFNYDYERKANANAEPRSWEEIGSAWYPFVRVPLEPDVTAIVGANESGKSHLIGALSRALTGEKIDRKDFCRYSSLYSVETDEMRVPDFGVEAVIESQADRDLANSLGVESDRLTLLRMGSGNRLLMDGDGEPRILADDELNKLEAGLPLPFVLETEILRTACRWTLSWDESQVRCLADVPEPKSLKFYLGFGEPPRRTRRRSARRSRTLLTRLLPAMTRSNESGSFPSSLGVGS